MASEFGELLRKMRRDASKTLGDVARHMNVSVVYVSDIERGQRRPFAADRIVGLARFLEGNVHALLQAADRDRGVIEYELAGAQPLAAQVVGDLVAGLRRGGVSKDQLEQIERVLKIGDRNGQ